MAAIVESCEDAVIGKTLDGIVTSWNAGAERLFGYTAAEMLRRSSSVLLPPALPRELSGLYELLKQGERIEHFETVRIRKDGTRLDVSLTISPIKNAAGRVVGVSAVARDISQRKLEERERSGLIQELSDSLARVKTLSGLLPICSGCKKIRNDAGYWQAVEGYIQQHTDAKFTHSLCQDCVKRLYPDFADEILKNAD
jgi:PAS domain S-box-containing protein